jgi:hypothetical protein
VQWSHHSDKEATWEHEDQLRSEYLSFFSSSWESRGVIPSRGGGRL